MNPPTSRRRMRTLGLAIAASAALAVPASALAQGAPSTSAGVQVHASASQSALSVAVRLAKGPNDGPALRVFIKSRTELAKARAEANEIVKHAITAEARVKAANALAIVARVESNGLPKLIGMIDDVTGALQKAVAKATLVDTMARDRAVDVLQVLLTGVPAAAQGIISQTVSSLMTGHSDELNVGASILVDVDVPGTVKNILSTVLGAGLQGQAGAAGGLKDLIGILPAGVQTTLTSAFDMVKQEQQKAFTLLGNVLDAAPLPASVRSIVTGVMETTRNLLNGLFSSLTPSQPVATAPAPSTGGSTPTTTPATGGTVPAVTLPTDLLSGILGPGSMPINLLNSILGSIPNPMTIVNGILGGLTGSISTTPATGTGTPSVFPDPTQLLNALLPGGLNPFQLLSGILGGATTP